MQRGFSTWCLSGDLELTRHQRADREKREAPFVRGTGTSCCWESKKGGKNSQYANGKLLCMIIGCCAFILTRFCFNLDTFSFALWCRSHPWCLWPSVPPPSPLPVRLGGSLDSTAENVIIQRRPLDQRQTDGSPRSTSGS